MPVTIFSHYYWVSMRLDCNTLVTRVDLNKSARKDDIPQRIVKERLPLLKLHCITVPSPCQPPSECIVVYRGVLSLINVPHVCWNRNLRNAMNWLRKSSMCERTMFHVFVDKIFFGTFGMLLNWLKKTGAKVIEVPMFHDLGRTSRENFFQKCKNLGTQKSKVLYVFNFLFNNYI